MQAIALLALVAGAGASPIATLGAVTASAQVRDPLIRAHALAAGAPVKIFFPTGSIRIEAWDRDSIEARGRIGQRERFFMAGDMHGMKLGVEDHPDGSRVAPSDLVLYVPRSSQISVKSVSATITSVGAAGWFYSVSGAIRLSGQARSVEVESLAGDVMLDVNAPWVRARTGDGHLVVRGAPEDIDAATVRGPLDIESSSIVHGRFASVQGDIRFLGAPVANGLLEFSNHGGTVSLLLPRAVSATLDLSSIEGPIENRFTQLQPAASAAPSDGGGTLRLRLGGGGPRVTVRTFKGAIRLQAR
ncbi:MAG: DUF4097 family beta strand repeat-containing protein [Gemmatimonadaceae bacterium]